MDLPKLQRKSLLMNNLISAGLISLAHFSKILTGLFLLKGISFYLGPSGLGYLGHLLSFVTIFNVISGGGIGNGIIKFSSELKGHPEKLIEFLSSAASYSFFFSIVTFALLFVFSDSLNILLFQSSKITNIIYILCLSQFSLAISTFVSSFLNGIGDTKTYAIIQIIGNFLAIPIIWYLICTQGTIGAAISIVITFAFLSIPSLVYYFKSPICRKVRISFKYKFYFKDLSRFTLMLLFSALMVPVTEIALRQLLITKLGLDNAGQWQASIKLSSAYLGFFGMFLTYNFLPKISEKKHLNDIFLTTRKYMITLGGIFSLAAVMIYLLRSVIIPIIFSKDFSVLNELIHMQLLGDLFKVLSITVGFVFVSRTMVKRSLFLEVFQSLLLISITTLFVTINPTLSSVFYAYVLSYSIYFVVIFSSFYVMREK